MNELKKQDSNLEAYFITDTKFATQTKALLKKASFSIKVKTILAGKFRRYHNISFLKQLLDISTTFQNIVDLFWVGVGLIQSFILIWRIKPDVVFAKGGFVCLPVGLAAAMLKKPLVIHDSDAHAGLTNRILARFATVIATGSPLENYNYPIGRAHYVGIPVDSNFKPVSPINQAKLKTEIGLNPQKPLLVVTGGGLGARNLNLATVEVAPKILKKASIIHITGAANFDEVQKAAADNIDYYLKSFVSEGMAKIFGAADIVVTRAGATTLQELAAMAKPIIIIPNKLLTGGHQVKNAEVYQRAKAAIIIDEDNLICDPDILAKTINELLGNPEKRQAMAKALYRFAKNDAATDTAALIAEAAASQKKD